METDDEVLANLPSDLAALYDRVKRAIKTRPGGSRAEAFLQWAESHPDQVLAATSHPADVAVRELEAEAAGVKRRLNPYEERKAARIDRMKERAARLETAAAGAHERARAIADRIPMGQPISGRPSLGGTPPTRPRAHSPGLLEGVRSSRARRKTSSGARSARKRATRCRPTTPTQ